MESKRKQKTIISIIIALLLGHFLVIGLTTLFADQINALIPNRFYCELFKEAAWAVVVLFCMFIFRKTEIFKITLTQMLRAVSAGSTAGASQANRSCGRGTVQRRYPGTFHETLGRFRQKERHESHHLHSFDVRFVSPL